MRENLLLLVDQFEEIFRFYRDEGGRDEVQAFIERLLYAASQEEVPIYVIVTMRSDFLGHCAALKGSTEAINRSQDLTPNPTRDQCRKAIERPIRLFGSEIEPILVNRLLNDLGSDVDQMPTLQALGTAGSYAKWDLSEPTPMPVQDKICGLEGTIDGASLSNDGRRLAFYTNTGEVGFVELRHDASYTCVKQPDGDAPATKLVNITLSPDGRRLVTLDLFGQAHLWDLDMKPSDRPPVSLVSGDRPVSAVAFSDDNRRLAIGDVRGAVRIWDPVAGRELARWDTALAGPVTALELDRSGKRLVAAGNRIVKIWDLTPGGATFSAERTLPIPTIGVITSLTLCGDEAHPAGDDACYLAIAGDDNTVRVRQVRDLLAKPTDDAFTVPHLVTLSGHQGPILETAFDPNARLVSVSLDGTARRWTIRPTELKEIARL